MDIGLLL
jgi:hypothetical protein